MPTITRSQLHGTLRRAVPDALWDHLVRAGYTQEAGVSKREVLESASRHAKELLALNARLNSELGAKGPAKAESTHTPEPSRSEHAYSEAVTQTTARFAESLLAARGFRDRVMGGLMSEAEAAALLQSPAARLLSRDMLREHGIPLLGHSAVFVDDPDVEPPPGTLMTLPDGREMVWLGPWRGPFLHVAPPGKTILAADGQKVTAWYNQGERPVLYYWPPGGKCRGLEPFMGSLLWELWREARTLLDATDEWGDHWRSPARQADVAGFILTGRLPAVPPVTVRSYRHSNQLRPAPGGDAAGGIGAYSNLVFVITAKPWASAATVKKALREARRQDMPVTGSLVRRRSKDRNLEIYAFVEEQTRLHRRRPAWRQLCDAWNTAREGPPMDVRVFRRNYGRAEKALAEG